MFVQVIEGRTSDPAALQERLEVWQRDIRPGAIGFLGSAGGCTPDGSCLIMARFDSAESARRNSERPEQNRWWEETAACFDGEVTFHDTEDVQVMTHGSLADAHFVQVMEGHVTNRERAEALEHQAEPVLAEFRPDLLGSITAFYGDGEYTDVAYFTSEEDARRGERSEMPPAMAENFGEWERLMKVDRYLDFTQPWLTENA